MKRFIRITAALLCLFSVVGLASCTARDADVPEGMQNATANGSEFRLYLPTTWNLNSPYGISGGYFSLTQQSTVSVSKYQAQTEIPADLSAEQRIDTFWTAECKPVLESVAFNHTIYEAAPTESDLLGALPARRFQYTYIASGKDLRALQVVTEKSGYFYLFSFIAENDAEQSLYNLLIDDVEIVLDNFRFAEEPYLADEFVRPLDSSAEAPAGMYLASNNDVAYRFYAPNGWSTDQNNSIVSVYAENDRSSVTVVPYLPETETMTVDEFWALTVAQLKQTDSTFDETAVTLTERKLGERGAKVYEYTYTVGGNTYYYKQAVAAYKSMIYSVTYTAATQDIYHAHSAEVDTMLDAFTFR